MNKLVLLLAGLGAALAAEAQPSAARQAALAHLVKQDCGSCHGLTLKGGLGTPLTREALAQRSRELIVATIAQGRPGTAMPPWGSLLSAQDIEWIADQLLSGALEPGHEPGPAR